MAGVTHPNLMAGSNPTHLPPDSAAADLVGRRPTSSGSWLRTLIRAWGWALLAEQALSREAVESDVAAYAYARTGGYHRGLDALRRSGWKGRGRSPGNTS